MNGKRRTLIFGVVAGIALAIACGQAAMDDGAQASEGQVALTLQMLTGGKMVRDDMYAQLSVKTA